MYVSGLRVRGLKCFSGPRAVDLRLDAAPGWNVLAGPNGAGKSTLLRALALALGAHPPVDPERWLAPGCAEGAVELPGLAHWRLTRAGAEGSGDGAARYFGASLNTPEEIPAATIELLSDGLLPDGWRAFQDVGDGIARLATLVAALPQAGIVLIDDIDAHLHLNQQRRIGGWLTERFPEVQFIVATHSPYVCQAADPGALIRLAGPELPEPPRVLDEDEQQRIVYGSGDDTALSDLFGLASPYSPGAEAERRLLVQLERKLYTGQASKSELVEYQELVAKLNSSLQARVDEVAARLGRADR